MVKETPSAARLAAMVLFAASCVGILLYLWLVFGGSVPLRPEGYRVNVQFPEATQLAQEADVRISGVNVGKVKTKKPDNRTGLTETVIELKERYAPIPRDTRAILRQKTLLGETYVELSPGTRGKENFLADGGRLPTAQVSPTVELDEIFRAFDPKTREALEVWMDRQGAQRSARQPRAVCPRRGRRAGDPQPPGARHPGPGARHRRGVRRAHRAPGPAAASDRKLQPRVRDHRLARPRAGRHLRRVPHVPARDPGNVAPAHRVRPEHRPAGRPAATGGTPALAHAHRAERHGARPARPVPRPRPAGDGFARRAPGAGALAGRHPPAAAPDRAVPAHAGAHVRLPEPLPPRDCRLLRQRHRGHPGLGSLAGEQRAAQLPAHPPAAEPRGAGCLSPPPADQPLQSLLRARRVLSGGARIAGVRQLPVREPAALPAAATR